jgi:ATP-dependent Lhr-like helicase
VFRKYDPANRLLQQAEEELLAQELEIGRLRAALARMASQRLTLQTPQRPTPFAFPLMVELFREKLSNESAAERIARMVAQLEQAAGGTVEAADPDRVRRTLAFERPVEDSQGDSREGAARRSSRGRGKSPEGRKSAG